MPQGHRAHCGDTEMGIPGTELSSLQVVQEFSWILSAVGSAGLGTWW